MAVRHEIPSAESTQSRDQQRRAASASQKMVAEFSEIQIALR
jgi:hypothetical protein